jgi:ribonuclease T2
MFAQALRRVLHLAVAAFALGVSHAGTAEERDKPGAFDYYTLVLSWSPSYCASEGRNRRDRQCDAAKQHGFVLHGLWPQYDRGWPEDCFTGRRPWVPQDVIEAMRDIMPNRNLIIHEYRAHGTCSGLDPEAYFAAARALYQRLEIPARYAAPHRTFSLSPQDIERDFAAANPWLKPETMAVTCRSRKLFDIRICFNRDLSPRGCGRNEDQKLLCPIGNIAVPPARSRP